MKNARQKFWKNATAKDEPIVRRTLAISEPERKGNMANQTTAERMEAA